MQAGVAGLSWRVTSRGAGRCRAAQLGRIRQMKIRCRAAQLASIRQMSRQVSRGSAGEYHHMSRQVSRGSAGEYQADEQAGVAWLSW